jgi:hypothetical protein
MKHKFKIPIKDNFTDEERKALIEAGKKIAKELFEQKFGKKK